MRFSTCILLVFLFLAGCERAEPEPNFLPIDPEFKAWCAFKPGTWWTYKEITTGATDSLWVTYYVEQAIQAADDFNYYQFGMHIESGSDTFGTHYFVAAPLFPSDSQQWNLAENYNIGQGTLAAGRYYYKVAGNPHLSANISIVLLDSLSLTLSGDVYYYVEKITHQVSEYGNWIKSEYFVRNIGVIRRELFNGEVWEIENYAIVQ